MNADSFPDLALRVLAREATEEERRALETAITSDGGRRKEFEQLKAAHDLLLAVAPMTAAIAAREPELPAHRLNELRTAVRQHFGPASTRKPAQSKYSLPTSALRWLLGGSVTTALAIVVILMGYSDRSIEVGLYRTDMLRGGEMPLSPADVPAARVVTFDQDAPFDQWKKDLAWNQHAKIWVDNENDLLHIVRRTPDGHLIEQTEPLVRTNQEQGDQISRAIQSLRK
jgi:hypothetical protein